jgi:hypothetical protein
MILQSLAVLAACFIMVPCLAYSSTLKMETIFSSETWVEFYQNIRHYAEYENLHKLYEFGPELLVCVIFIYH